MRRRRNQDDDEILQAIEDEIQASADERAAESASYLGDDYLVYYNLEDEYENVLAIAEIGDAVAVDSDLLVPPGYYEILGMRSPKRVELWSESKALDRLVPWLRKQGWVKTEQGGRVFSEEQEIQTDHILSAVAKELGVPISDVQRVARNEGMGELVYTSSSGGNVDIWMKPI